MFNIGDVVTVTGKVNYVIAAENADGSYTAESMNTGKARVFEADKLKLVASADTEPMNTPQDTELNRTQVIAESAPAKVTVPEFYNRPEDDFDPRSDRRQSAYGLAILNALMRKGANNPRQFSHNSNALKPIGSKRAKVRKSVKARRTRMNALSAQYNALIRENGYTINAA